MVNTEQNIALPINVDLVDGKVAIPGRALGPAIYHPNLARQIEGQDAESFAIVVQTTGDKRPLAIAFISDGAGRELDVVSLKVALKEFEPSILLPIHVGDGTDFRAVEFPDGTVRYITRVFFDPDQLAIVLSNYEDDYGTWVDMLAEIEAIFRYQRLGGSVVASGLANLSSGPTTSAPVTVTPKLPLDQSEASESYTLQVFASLLAPDGYVLQRAEILQNVTVTKSGGDFDDVALGYTVSPAFGRQDYPWPTWIEQLDVVGLTDENGKLGVETELTLSGWQDPNDGLTFGGTVWVVKVPGVNWTWTDSGGIPKIVQQSGRPNSAVQFALKDSADPNSGNTVANFSINGSTVLGDPITNPGFSLDEPLQVMIPEDREQNYFELLWTVSPAAGSAGNIAAVHVESLPDEGQGPTFLAVTPRPWPTDSVVRVQAKLLANSETGYVTDTISSQEFVIRARRELIPTAEPATT